MDQPPKLDYASPPVDPRPPNSPGNRILCLVSFLMYAGIGLTVTFMAVSSFGLGILWTWTAFSIAAWAVIVPFCTWRAIIDIRDMIR